MKKRPPLLNLLSVRILAVSLFLTLCPLPSPAQVIPGSLVVLDPIGGRIFQGALFIVKPDGSRFLLSDLGDLAQGPRLVGSGDFAVAPSGYIYYPSSTLVVGVNPLTGNRRILTDGEDTDQGPEAQAFFGIAVDAQEQIYVSDVPANKLFRVDPLTGNRSILSAFDDEAQGPTILRGDRILLETEDTILVLDRGGTKVVRVFLDTGDRELVTDFSDASKGPSVRSLSGFCLEPSGDLLVTSFASHLLIRVDLTTLERTVVTDFDDLELGPKGRLLEGVAADASGRIFVVDSQADLSLNREGAVFEVFSDGKRAVVTDFSDDTQGPKGAKPSVIGVAVPVEATTADLQLVRSVLLATDNLRIQKSAVVHSGNLYVNGPSGSAVVNKAATAPKGFDVGANSLTIKKAAVVGNVRVDNRFENKGGTVLGSETIENFPIFVDGLPPLQTAMTGGGNVVVQKSSFLSLTEGRYGKISVKKDAVLQLEPGVYDIEALKVSKGAEVIFTGPVVIRSASGVKFGKDSTFSPADDTFLDARDAVMYTQGGLKTGKGSSVQINIVSPDGNCKFGKFAELFGFAYCRNISLGKSAEATLSNFLEDSVLEP